MQSADESAARLRGGGFTRRGAADAAPRRVCVPGGSGCGHDLTGHWKRISMGPWPSRIVRALLCTWRSPVLGTAQTDTWPAGNGSRVTWNEPSAALCTRPACAATTCRASSSRRYVLGIPVVEHRGGEPRAGHRRSGCVHHAAAHGLHRRQLHGAAHRPLARIEDLPGRAMCVHRQQEPTAPVEPQPQAAATIDRRAGARHHRGPCIQRHRGHVGGGRSAIDVAYPGRPPAACGASEPARCRALGSGSRTVPDAARLAAARARGANRRHRRRRCAARHPHRWSSLRRPTSCHRCSGAPAAPARWSRPAAGRRRR